MKKSLCILFFGIASLGMNISHAVQANDILPDNQNAKECRGILIRKGTMAATIQNIKALDNLMLNSGFENEIQDLLNDQRSLCKALWASELLDILPIEIWLRDPMRPGKIIVAAMILQECPQLMNQEIKEILTQMLPTACPSLKLEIEKAL